MDDNNLIVDPKEYGLDEKQAKEVENGFLPVIKERDNLLQSYSDIVSKEISLSLTKQARDLRLKLVKIRTDSDKIHKALKAFYLAGGRFVDAWRNKNKTIIEQMEEKLGSIENHYENIEKQKREKLESGRKELLKPFIDESLIPAGLGIMAEEVFNNYLSDLKIAFNTKIENERKAEEQRIEKEKKEKEEQDKIKLENERLKKEAEERERLAKIERDKLEKEKRELEAKAKKEAEERERIEREIQLKKAQEEKERKEKILAEKKLARQPDKKKLEMLAEFIIAVPMPDVKSDEAKQIISSVKELLNKTKKYIEQQLINL